MSQKDPKQAERRGFCTRWGERRDGFRQELGAALLWLLGLAVFALFLLDAGLAETKSIISRRTGH